MSASQEMALAGLHLQPQSQPRPPRQERIRQFLTRPRRKSKNRSSKTSSSAPHPSSRGAAAGAPKPRAPANGPAPEVKDFLRSMEGSSFGERTWSSGSSMLEPGEFVDYGDRDGERRISGRWSRDLAKAPVQHRSRGCSLGVMLNVNVEYDDVQQRQLPQVQYMKDMDDHPDAVLHGATEVEWHMRKKTYGASNLQKSATMQKDDTATSPWDTPSQREEKREDPHLAFQEAPPTPTAHVRIIPPRQHSSRQVSFSSYHGSHTDPESTNSRPSSPSTYYVSLPRNISESSLVYAPVQYATRPNPSHQPYIHGQLSGAPGQTPMTPTPQPAVVQTLTKPKAPLLGTLSKSGSPKQCTASQSPKTRSRPRTPTGQSPLSLEHSTTLKDRRPSSRPAGRGSSQKSAKPVHRHPAQPLPLRRSAPGSPHSSPIRSPSLNGGLLRHPSPPSEPPSLQPRINGPDIYRPESPPKSSASQIRAPVGTQMKNNVSPQIPKIIEVGDTSKELELVPNADLVHDPEPGKSSSSIRSELVDELVQYAPQLPPPPVSPVIYHTSDETKTSHHTPSELGAEEQLQECSEEPGYTDESDSSRPRTPLPTDVEGHFQKSPSMQSFLDDSESSRPQTPTLASTMQLSIKSPESVKSLPRASESPEPQTSSKKDIENLLQKSPERHCSRRESAASLVQDPTQKSIAELSGTLLESVRSLSDASESSPTQSPSQAKEVDQPPTLSLRSPAKRNLNSPIQQSDQQSPTLLKLSPTRGDIAMLTPLDLPQNEAIVKSLITTSAKESQHSETQDPSPHPEGKHSKAPSESEENESDLQHDSSVEATKSVHPLASSEFSPSRLPQENKNPEESEAVTVSRVSSEIAISRSGDNDLAPLFHVNPVSEKSPEQGCISDIGAESLIRRSSQKPWDKGFDGIPRNKWANAVIRATSRSFEPPIDKHVRTVLEGIRNGGSPTNTETPVGAVLVTLKERFDTPQWTIRLKTALFCHTVFRAGISKFVEHVARAHKDLFDARKFVVDGAFDACEKSQLHKSFAEEYARYLEAWLSMKAEAKFPAGRTIASSSRRFKSASARDLLKSLPKLIDTLGRVAPLELHPEIEDSSIADAVISLVLKDSKTIVNALDAGINRLVELYPGLPGQYAVDALRVYGNYKKVLAEVKPVLHRMNGEESAWMRSLNVTPRLPERKRIHKDGWKGKTPMPQRIRVTTDNKKRKDPTGKAPRQRNAPPVVRNEARDIKNVKKGGGMAKPSWAIKPAYKIYDDETHETEVVTSVGTDDVDLLFGSEDADQRPSTGRQAEIFVQEDEVFPMRSRYPSD